MVLMPTKAVGILLFILTMDLNRFQAFLLRGALVSAAMKLAADCGADLDSDRGCEFEGLHTFSGERNSFNSDRGNAVVSMGKSWA